MRNIYASLFIATCIVPGNKFSLLEACMFAEIPIEYIGVDERGSYTCKLLLERGIVYFEDSTNCCCT
jgi:hypothetical protein